MLNLHADLTAAQKSPSAVPIVQVTARHAEAGQYLPRFAAVYQGAETDNYHAAAVTASGALIRAWTTPTNRLLVERAVIDGAGDPAIPFGQNWVNLGTVSDVRGCAVATSGQEVLIFAVDTAGTALVEYRSTNDGVSYTGPTTRVSAAGITWMAAVAKSDGAVALIWSTGATGGGAGAALHGARRDAALVWSAAVSASLLAGDIFGAAAAAPPTGSTAFNVAAAGRTPNSGAAPLAPRIWGLTFTDANPPVFSATFDIEVAESGLIDKYEYHNVFLLNADRLRMTYRRGFLGQVFRDKEVALTAVPSPAHAVTQGRWREPTIAETTRGYGLALAGPGGGAFLWLTSPGCVLRAPAAPGPSRDLAADILSLRARWTGAPGGLDLTLDNAKGQYNDLDEQLSDALTVGAELVVKLGYRTASGPRTAEALPLYRVEALTRLFSDGRNTVTVRARDALHQMSLWRNPSQIVLAPITGNLLETLHRVAARAGYQVGGNVGPLSSQAPYFNLNPGQPGLNVARRIVGKVSQALIEKRGTLTLRDEDAAEPAVYSFGPSYFAEVMADRPAGYWRLGERPGATSAFDASPTAAAGAYTGGVTLGAAGALTGDPDTAATFDGVNDTVQVPDNIALRLTSLTLELWFRPLASPQAKYLIAKGADSEYSLYFENQPAPRVSLYRNGDAFGSNTVWTTGVKYHIVVTHDQATNTVRHFVNGVQDGPDRTLTDFPTGAAALYIGSRFGGGNFVNADIDEVAVYDHVLTADRIQAHYQAGLAAFTVPGHAVRALAFASVMPEANETSVFGLGRSDIARDTESQWKSGPVLRLIDDRADTLNSEVTAHAAAALREAALAVASDELAPSLPNVGLELYDVITITHPGLGLTNARRRVTGISFDYRAGASGAAPRFEQRLTLGTP